MYSLPSTSQMWAPSPRPMNSGSPPTERKARTGELTPPGIDFWARSNRVLDLFVVFAIVARAFVSVGVSISVRVRDSLFLGQRLGFAFGLSRQDGGIELDFFALAFLLA